MGLTKTLLNELVWPAFTAAKSYIKPKTINLCEISNNMGKLSWEERLSGKVYKYRTGVLTIDEQEET